jgi:PAS domain S-box-containing protein
LDRDPLERKPGATLSIHIVGDTRPLADDAVASKVDAAARAEEALRASEERFRALFEQAADSLVLVDAETGRLVEFNDKACENLGYTREEFQHLGLPEVAAIESPEAISKHIQKAFQQGGDIFETKHRTKQGEIRDVLVNAKAMSIGGKKFIQGIFRDITEQKQAAEALRSSNERYRDLFTYAPISIWEQDFSAVARWFNDLRADGVTDLGAYFERHPEALRKALRLVKVRDINAASWAIFKAKNKEELLQGVSTIFTPETYEAFGRELQRIWNGERHSELEFEFTARTLEGHRFDGLFRWVAPQVGGRIDLSRLVIAIVDITGQKRAEASLRESEERYRALFEQAADSIVLIDAETGRLTAFNDRACENLGYTREEFQTLGIADFEVVESPEEISKHLEKIIEQGSDIFETKHMAREGQIRDVLVSSMALSIPGKNLVSSIWRDITEQKRAERELTHHRDHLEKLVEERSEALERSLKRLRQSERLASIGTLASGIAHEINNPLGMIQLVAETALRFTDDPERIEEMLGQIISDVTRCSHIVKSVLRFAKEQPTEKWASDLNDIIRHSLDCTREYATRHGVVCVERLCKKLPSVQANPTELEQVFVNLISNAVNSCEPGGSVRLETEHAGDRVRAVVRDDGCGMTKDQVEHAFDPFYTTRLEQGGTGLGLSTCHGIVANHGGEIEIESKERQGTTVIIELPIADMPEQGVPA